MPSAPVRARTVTRMAACPVSFQGALPAASSSTTNGSASAGGRVARSDGADGTVGRVDRQRLAPLDLVVGGFGVLVLAGDGRIRRHLGATVLDIPLQRDVGEVSVRLGCAWTTKV